MGIAAGAYWLTSPPQNPGHAITESSDASFNHDFLADPPPGDESVEDEEHATSEPLPAISPEMAAAIRQLSNHSTEGLKETVNADGSVTLHHEGHFQSVMAGVKGPDGKMYIRHGEEFLSNIKNP